MRKLLADIAMRTRMTFKVVSNQGNKVKSQIRNENIPLNFLSSELEQFSFVKMFVLKSMRNKHKLVLAKIRRE